MATYNEKVVLEIINCIKDGGFPLFLDVDKGRVEVLTPDTQVRVFTNMLNMNIVESGVASYKWGRILPSWWVSYYVSPRNTKMVIHHSTKSHSSLRRNKT